MLDTEEAAGCEGFPVEGGLACRCPLEDRSPMKSEVGITKLAIPSILLLLTIHPGLALDS